MHRNIKPIKRSTNIPYYLPKKRAYAINVGLVLKFLFLAWYSGEKGLLVLLAGACAVQCLGLSF